MHQTKWWRFLNLKKRGFTMKKTFLFFITFFCIWTVRLESQKLTILNEGAVPASISKSNYIKIQKALFANLNDLENIISTTFITPAKLETWVNILIDEKNAAKEAEYLHAINLGKKPAIPQKILPLKILPFNTTKLKSITNYLKPDQILNITYTPVQRGLSLNFSLQNINGKTINTTPLTVIFDDLNNYSKINRMIKESLITLYNLWGNYYYLPKKTGNITLLLSPPDAICTLPDLGIKLLNNSKEILPQGNYRAIVSASNHFIKFTNILVTDKPTIQKISLKKFVVRSNEIGKPPTGRLFIESDIPGAKFVIMETGDIYQTPAMISNLNTKDINIVFDETKDYPLKRLNLKIRENITLYEKVKLIREESRLKIESTNENALVILDKEIMGEIKNNEINLNPTEGLHSLTIFKDFYEVYRTNVNIYAGKMKTIKAGLNKKNPAGYFITPQSANVAVKIKDQTVGTTPFLAKLNESDSIEITFYANPNGYINLTTNISWRWDQDNNVIASLKPLFGELTIGILNSDLSNVALFVDNIYRGRTGPNPLTISRLLARSTKIRLEAEGYRTLNTNVLVFPNVNTSYSFMMKESPVKGFITTSPEKEFEVFINDSYVGLSGSGALPLELGKSSLKLKKRGFKTIYTNIEILTKDPVILLFTTTPGESEDEFLERIESEYSTIEQNIHTVPLTNSIKELKNLKEKITESEYATISQTKEKLNKIDVSISKIEEEIKKIAEEELKKEEETKFSAFFDKISKIVNDGDYLLSSNKLTEAYSKYDSAIKMIEQSQYKDNSKLRSFIIRAKDGIKEVQKKEKIKKGWWQTSKRAWTGFYIDLLGMDIAKEWELFNSTTANPFVSLKANLEILPLFGISIGGLYNFNYNSKSKQNAFVDSAMGLGFNLRIPVIAQWSFYGDYQFLIDDFYNVDLLNKTILMAGTELKWGAFSVKIFYQLGLKDHFKTFYHGGGIGVALWLQGD